MYADGTDDSVREQIMLNTSRTAAELESRVLDPHTRVSRPKKAYSFEIGQNIQLKRFAASPRQVHSFIRWDKSTKTLNFPFGKVTLRRSVRGAYPTDQRGRFGTDLSYISATFIPSPLFWQTRICLHAEWAGKIDSFTVPAFSLQFFNIVHDRHPLILASIRVDLSAIKKALESRDVSPLCSTTVGWTPLHYAAAYGHTEACRLLITQGASVTAAGIRGISPLHLAAHFGYLEVFKTLVDAGMDPEESTEHGLNAILEMLSIGAGSSSMNLAEFLKWLIHGQNRFLLDMRTRDNSQRSILYHLANPHDWTESSQDLTFEQASAIRYALDEGAEGDELDFHEISLLHEACRDNRMDLVQLLLSSSCDVDGIDKRGYTALHYAVESENLELVALLIENDADVCIEAHDDYYKDWFWSGRPTPLYLAAKIDHFDMAKLLIEHGAARYNEDVSHAFHVAVKAGSMDTVRYFVEHTKNQLDLSLAINTADDDAEMIEEIYRVGAPLDGRDEFGWTPLLIAARSGWTNAVRILVDFGADLNQAQGNWTPLHFAVAKGYADIVSILLAAGTRADALDEQGSTLTQLAFSHGFDDIAELLAPYISGDRLRSMSDPVPKSGYALRISEGKQAGDADWDPTDSCIKGDLAILEKLMAKGCSFNTGKRYLWSPLSLAIDWNRWEIVRLLIQAGVELNDCGITSCGNRDMPFVSAVRQGHTAIVEYMIAHGADVQIRTEDGATPLLKCLDLYWSKVVNGDKACYSNDKIVRALLKAGACVNVTDDYGRTPLGMAAALGHLESVFALVEAGAELDTMSSQNSPEPISWSEERTFRTPIAWAAVKGHESVVRYLFESGAEWRCLRNEPAVWYTHRLLMEAHFPRIGDNNSSVRNCVLRSESSRCETNSEYITTILKGNV